MWSGRLDRAFVVVLCACIACTTQAGAVIYVDATAGGTGDGSSWAKAYPDLQDALTAAAAAAKPVEIRVAEGTYRPKPAASGQSATIRNWNATFQLLKGVTLEGGYAGSTRSNPDARNVEWYTTILSGNLHSNNPGTSTSQANARNVVTGSGTDATAVIDGFTITDGLSAGIYVSSGNPTVIDCTFKGGMVHGFECFDGANIALTRCSFSDTLGPGVYVWDCNCVLTGCSFTRDGGFGAAYCVAGSLTARDCTFTENDRGAIHCTGALDLIGCSFTANGREPGLRTIDCQDVTARGCKFIANAGWLSGAIDAWGDVILVDCEFIGNSGLIHAGAVSTFGSGSIIASGCVFAGNSCISMMGGGAIFGMGEVLKLSNCTFIGNRGQANSVYCWPSDIQPKLTQCIVWDGPNPFPAGSTPLSPDISVTYSDVQGGWSGKGNIDVDPCFVDPGHWDPNGTPDDPADDIWVAGNYHLKSQAGHWDRSLEDWVYDNVTSRCIDAGDPNAAVGPEPFPNGGYTNLGAYGGTVEASRTWFGGPVCPLQLAGDINGDCKVDDLDVDILLQHWLMQGWEQTNKPPIITLTSPQNGAELTAPTPIVLQADASDPDGTVLRVSYTLEYRQANSLTRIGTSTFDPANGWERQLNWTDIRNDGVYTIWAEAMDDEGARTTSAPITVMLHPSPK